MDLADDVGLGEEQDLVVALEILAGPVLEAVAAVLGFAELVTLDHGAHGAIDDDKPLAEAIHQIGAACIRDLGGGRNLHGERLPRETAGPSHKSIHQDGRMG